MATTTNYGWTTPDDTALVKDGASAIRTLGSSIDTTTKNLNPQTTLGDLAYRSSTANVNTRLALGTANQQLRVNSGATAPEWFTPAVSSSGLTLINRSTFTNVANTSTTFDGVLTSTYKSYLIRIETLASSTQADDLQFQLRYSGTTDSDYYAGLWQLPYNGTTITNTGGANVAVVTLASASRTSPFFPFSGDINLSNIGTTLRANIYGLGHESNNIAVSIISGQASEERTFTGFILKSASANISGTVAVYGLATS